MGKRKTPEKLELENKELKQRLDQLEKFSESLTLINGAQPEQPLLTHEYFDLISRDYMYRMLIENMSEGALVINKHQTIVYSNQQFADLTGFPLQKIIGSDFKDFLNEEDAEYFSGTLRSAEKKKSFSEINLTTKAKEKITILASITSFLMEEGTYNCIIVTDISQHKKIKEGLEDKIVEHSLELAVTNKRLKEINQELNDTNEYLDNFVHTIAHDLRAPVANLLLVEEILQDAPEHARENLLASIHDNIHKLDIILKGLVQIINTQGKKASVKTDIDVADIIYKVLNEQEKRIKVLDAIVNIERRTNEKITYVEEYIKSIARNMISNALKYFTPERQPILNVVFEKADGFYLISFEDNGIGIDLKSQGKSLFKPFQRISSDRKGMGIGLHLVHTMVRKNGGYINVESVPGKGTKFTVYLKEYQE